jgi:hypothetical protein
MRLDQALEARPPTARAPQRDRRNASDPRFLFFICAISVNASRTVLDVISQLPAAQGPKVR